jgi:hypothetical protein
VGRLTRQFHRSKRLALLALAASAACSKDPRVTTRTVTAHVPRACAPDGSAYAVFRELGDFEPTTPATGHVLGAVGTALPEIDTAARALLVQATDKSNGEWLGLGEVPESGDVDVLLLPSLASCSVSTLVGQRTGATLGPIGAPRVLVVGGGSPTAQTTVASTFVVRLDTGQVAAVTQDLLTPRTQATVTEFGDGGLVAGGLDRSGTPQATAEVYSPDLDGFQQQQPILLSQARAGHGAAVLVTGETLLVGGVGADGHTVLDTMEVVDPASRTVRAENVAALAVARRGPTVLRLASGEILVAGGLDAGNSPVATIEWFAPDASQPTKRHQDLVTGSSARAYVALEAGGALAVFAPPSGAAASFQSVWVIDADGGFTAATPLGGLLGQQPVLLGGAGGAPVLFASGRWLRWQPYSGAFGVLGVDIAANVGDGAASPDPGLALWLDPAAGAVAALRFDAIGEYAGLEGPLWLMDTADTAPDRLASAGAITFDPAVGLSLGPGASAFVTDRTYADVTVDVDAPTGEPAMVVLRDELGSELEVGGTACPAALAARGASSSLHIARTGANVAWAIAGGSSGACPGGVRQAGRLSIGVRAPASVARSVARNARIKRIGNP